MHSRQNRDQQRSGTSRCPLSVAAKSPSSPLHGKRGEQAEQDIRSSVIGIGPTWRAKTRDRPRNSLRASTPTADQQRPRGERRSPPRRRRQVRRQRQRRALASQESRMECGVWNVEFRRSETSFLPRRSMELTASCKRHAAKHAEGFADRGRSHDFGLFRSQVQFSASTGFGETVCSVANRLESV